MLASTLLYIATLVSVSTAGYVLEDDYSPESFFSMFDFFTGADPTNGYVTYVDQKTAQSSGLINTNGGAVYMGVDHSNVASGSGRASVRVTSKKSYSQGLIVLDLAHMPGGICGTWPAFWTVGPSWPANGEIDIIEGVNSQSSNSMTLHTGAGCSVSNNGMFSGQILTPDCDVDAPGQSTNAGCQIQTSNTASFGTGFNSEQGGVYATEWTSEAISIWFFPRSAIPADIGSGTPDPSGWGTATASFSGCEIDQFFNNNQIVFDTTFCGDWAGNVWSTDPVCSAKASTCQQFVQNNPSAFVNAYWSVNSLQVYQSSGQSSASGSVTTSKPSSPVFPPSSIPASAAPPSITPAITTQSSSFSFGGTGKHSRAFSGGVVQGNVAIPSSTLQTDREAVKTTVVSSSLTTDTPVVAVVSEGMLEEATPAAISPSSNSQPPASETDEALSALASSPNATISAAPGTGPTASHRGKYVSAGALDHDYFSHRDEKEKRGEQQEWRAEELAHVKRHLLMHHRHLRNSGKRGFW